MAITNQAKRLKQYLKEAGVVDSRGKAPSVHTQTHKFIENGRRYTEYGRAATVIRNDHLTPEQVELLKAKSEYLRVTRLAIFTIIDCI
jgi:hypothetical protein